MPFVRLLVITDCCVIVVCLITIGTLALLMRHGQWRTQSGQHGRHEPHGQHRYERTGTHRVDGPVPGTHAAG